MRQKQDFEVTRRMEVLWRISDILYAGKVDDIGLESTTGFFLIGDILVVFLTEKNDFNLI